jgi:dynein heavy chain 1
MIFEVESLKYATLATVSRCGMVWFSEDVLTVQNIVVKKLADLKLMSNKEPQNLIPEQLIL